MQRFREALITTATIVALAAMAGETLAQQPGGGGGGGGRGGRGGFGPGGFGGFGGPGGSLLPLALNPAVQKELELTEPQKTKLTALNETMNQRRQKIREQFMPQGQQGGGRGNRNNGNANNQNGNANAQNGGGGGGFNGGGNGQGGQGGGNGQGGQGGGNGQGGQGGGRGGRGQQDPEAAARFVAMMEAYTELQQGSEQTLAKILSRGQYGRLKQIQLQQEGPRALLREDMIEKLILDEDQVAEIRELLNEGRQAQFQTFRARGDIMKGAFPQDNANNQANGGQAGNGGGGGGRPRGPNMRDPAVREAMQKYLEQPEVKEKLDAIQGQTDKLQKQLNSAVLRVLGKRQAANYKKMLGAPFDITQLRGRPGGPGGRGPGNPQNATTKTAAAPAANGDGEEGATAKPAPKTPSPAAAKSKRKSLREQRGLDD
jgi:hypothetical protein